MHNWAAISVCPPRHERPAQPQAQRHRELMRTDTMRSGGGEYLLCVRRNIQRCASEMKVRQAWFCRIRTIWASLQKASASRRYHGDDGVSLFLRMGESETRRILVVQKLTLRARGLLAKGWWDNYSRWGQKPLFNLIAAADGVILLEWWGKSVISPKIILDKHLYVCFATNSFSISPTFLIFHVCFVIWTWQDI